MKPKTEVSFLLRRVDPDGKIRHESHYGYKTKADALVVLQKMLASGLRSYDGMRLFKQTIEPVEEDRKGGDVQ